MRFPMSESHQSIRLRLPLMKIGVDHLDVRMLRQSTAGNPREVLAQLDRGNPVAALPQTERRISGARADLEYVRRRRDGIVRAANIDSG